MARSSRPSESEPMIKEQVLVLKVKYDDEHDQAPHTWNWTDVVGVGHEIEVMNHGRPEIARQE